MPALFRLFRQNFLPRDVRIVGYARTKMDHDEFLKRATSNLKVADDDQEGQAQVDKFKDVLSYVAGDYEDGAAFDKLEEHLQEIESKYQSKEANRIFYLALPPTVFVPVAKNLREHCYVQKNGVNRIIVEKPFGKDLTLRGSSSARSRSTGPRTRRSASTTTSARRWSRTCWSCASRTSP